MDTKGISIRLIKQWKAIESESPTLIVDRAIMLTCADDRDIPFNQKLDDALAFLKSRIH